MGWYYAVKCGASAVLAHTFAVATMGVGADLGADLSAALGAAWGVALGATWGAALGPGGAAALAGAEALEGADALAGAEVLTGATVLASAGAALAALAAATGTVNGTGAFGSKGFATIFGATFFASALATTRDLASFEFLDVLLSQRFQQVGGFIRTLRLKKCAR